MSDSDSPNGLESGATAAGPTWRPLTARQRRVLGTLMEKSKTTPDAYPMTFLGLTTGCNQKSNRAPINNYSQEQIEESVEQLREMGAVALIQGNGRVPKVRHYGYQWLGISKNEAAVMTELLLRGEQTIGELRTRASRMEPIADLGELQKLLHELHARKLIIYLSPAGRGQIVTHNLYQDHELQLLKTTIQTGGGSSESIEEESDEVAERPKVMASPARSNELQELRAALEALSARVKYLEDQLGVTGP